MKLSLTDRGRRSCIQKTYLRICQSDPQPMHNLLLTLKKLTKLRRHITHVHYQNI